MERKSQSAPARLIARLGDRLPYINFYRFCQLLEKSDSDAPVPGSTWQARQESVRFRPHPGMGFPAGEIRGAEAPAQAHLPPTVRINFMGLYGTASPLPTHYIDDITRQREGHEATQDFLDIFNHRLTTQFYRIWRKYTYPATFTPGGTDETSQYLLGLAGLGINGCAENIATPVSRFLALLPVMLLPGRTAEGVTSLVSLLAPDTRAQVIPRDPRRIPQVSMLNISTRHPVSLAHRPVMGAHATDVNYQVLLRLFTDNPVEIKGWLPGGQLHGDLMALLHVYLGAKLDARLELCVDRAQMSIAKLACRTEDAQQMGRTAVLPQARVLQAPERDMITIQLGRYQRVREQPSRSENDEQGDYRW